MKNWSLQELAYSFRGLVQQADKVLEKEPRVLHPDPQTVVCTTLGLALAHMASKSTSTVAYFL